MSLPESLHSSEHRPWPLPDRPWVMRMRWLDLAFLHWPVDAALLRPHVPAPLELDTFEGQAWLAVVPFRMSGVRPRFTPSLPGLSAFPEINLRTYVSEGSKPGVWFFSLDVTSRPCVVLARRFFHLPYNHARMGVERRGEHLHYTSRAEHDGASFEFAGTYRPRGPVFRAQPGSLEEWLSERYCLYSADRRGRVWRGEVHHLPWPLQEAEATIERNTLARALGDDVLAGPPLAHFARDLDVVAWCVEEVASTGSSRGAPT